MDDGFITVAAIAPKIRVGDVAYNTKQIKDAIDQARAQKVELLVLPELCVTGATCQDLLYQDTLLTAAARAVVDIAEYTQDKNIIVILGAPLRGAKNCAGDVFNCSVVINSGTIEKVIAKQNLSAQQSRWFKSDIAQGDQVVIDPSQDFFEIRGTSVLCCQEMNDFSFCVYLGTPRVQAMTAQQIANMSQANIVCNPDAAWVTGKSAGDLCDNISSLSSQLGCGYIYANAGWQESTTDFVYSGQTVIAEPEEVLSEGELFANELTIAQVDVSALAYKKRMGEALGLRYKSQGCQDTSFFSYKPQVCELTRPYKTIPFGVANDRQAEATLDIQARGLARRMNHIHAKKAVVGVSGGLDSTLTLLVMARAFDILSLDRSGILAISMPGFGTTKRTHSNARDLSDALGASYREISIAKAVESHFEDISHDLDDRNVTFENAQARERTQVIMDIANDENTFVVGTGDLSELALGWATYNGDQMSMYATNGSIPKTLVRQLVSFEARATENKALTKTLEDILATPVSPELLPANEDGTIAQVTEDKIGPYELHDFFLYHMLIDGMGPKKIYRITNQAFSGIYDKATIYTWLRTFYWRFFSQQFKRSCMPDGVCATEVSLSPRGGLVMPSDAAWDLWKAELDEIQV